MIRLRFATIKIQKEKLQNAVTNVLFTNTRNETSKRTVFQKNTDYTLKENLLFAKAEPMVLNQYEFSFGEKCQVKNVTMLNKKTEVWFTKTDWTDCEELEGQPAASRMRTGNVLIDELETQWNGYPQKNRKIHRCAGSRQNLPFP